MHIRHSTHGKHLHMLGAAHQDKIECIHGTAWASQGHITSVTSFVDYA